MKCDRKKFRLWLSVIKVRMIYRTTIRVLSYTPTVFEKHFHLIVIVCYAITRTAQATLSFYIFN